MHAKKLEELRHARAKLEMLAKAVVLVANDSDAKAILAEVLEFTADGTGTSVTDLQDLLCVAFAHGNARVEVAERSVQMEAGRV
jgi:hypothetical protein